MGVSKKVAIREWIIFAICLGLGAHVALGFLLHGEQGWPIEWYGMYGVFFGIFIYVVVQLGRSIWWIWAGGRNKSE